MPRTPPDEWRPHGIDDLEDAAWGALRHDGSCSVVAGPGAGKTEFLAQKVTYLLETGICPPSQRILAISFKSDAALNLHDRVARRCPPHLTHRFVSLTFDAFTKRLVDHFGSAIPERWRPRHGYDVLFPNRRFVQEVLNAARRAAPAEWRDGVVGLEADAFQQRADRVQMPTDDAPPRSAISFAIEQWWRVQLDGDVSRLTFGTINRIAELLLRARPQIRRALRATYPYVLVDEFQDTTYSQYDILKTAFDPSVSRVTTVGDLKQGIMRWAGAMAGPFDLFDGLFEATRFHLILNHRSSPALVRIQHVVAQRLDPTAAPITATAAQEVTDDVAQVWRSRSIAGETMHLAAWIAADRGERGLAPRDYAILVRQLATNYADQIAPAFEAAGLSLRNESQPLVTGGILLQDLVADEFARTAAHALRLGASRRAPDAWVDASRMVQALRVVDPENDGACRRASRELEAFAQHIRDYMRDQPPSLAAAQVLAERVFSFLDRDAIGRLSPAHGRGGYLPKVEDAFAVHFAASADGASSWQEALDAFEGVHHVPLMTVHKSKGLEFDTVLLVGLDDAAWWSHTADDPQVSTLFVALSRAKQRAVFSFCEERGGRANVADLYDLLREAGVGEINLGD